ncbi:zinc finger protein chinmo isoform X2 [Camponotus floridanus]|nr:zinc finger protein chinmo isoform X2 [Camponotus floridanus]XP_011265986.1 zinc finger protein chinmo isoform X2 [Camponotus floridanus]XP_025268782.1 zinc finger protein chinmo isoform X2 [Camponotus floridanus]XP_025268784.1 zinc finger protein chinmo isoform X2 [Camponotus floridanus]
MDSHQQQFCLKWNSFGSNLATTFSNLFKSESLTDVTLFCEGVTFKAHRLILAACSKHFQELFEGMPPSPAGLIVILDGTSAHNMASLLEFMYRGEVHVSQESLSSFLKAAECLQVKGLSIIEHEKLAVAQRHAAESSNTSADVEGSSGGREGSNGTVGSSVGSGNMGNIFGNGGGVGDVNDMSEAGEVTMPRNTMKRTPTPVPSPAPAYTVPNVYSSSHYYESLPKKMMRSPSDVDTLGRASVLRDGAAFRPASAPHPHLLDNHFYQPFAHPSDPLHPHTAPHTPTEMEQQLERARSEERSNCDIKESVAEDLRIKQEPTALTEKVDKLAERLSEVYSGRGFDASSYGPNSDHLPHGAQLGPAIVAPIVPAHPPTSDRKPTPAMWNTKINKASTVSTVDGGRKLKCPFCERLYGYETNLRAHVRQRHQGIRVPCPYCSRTFTRNNTVRRHIAREHKDELEDTKMFEQSNHSDTVPRCQ